MSIFCIQWEVWIACNYINTGSPRLETESKTIEEFNKQKSYVLKETVGGKKMYVNVKLKDHHQDGRWILIKLAPLT